MKIRISSIIFCMLFSCIISAQESVVLKNGTNSSAILPLPELLKLYQDIDSAKEKPKKSPPLNASITSIQLEGHLLEDAVDITANFEVVVLADDEWITIPLLYIDKGMHISSLPDIENAVIARTQKAVSFITQNRGKYSFAVSFIKRAQKISQNRMADIVFGNAAKLELALRYDDDLFRILGNNLLVKADHVVIYPVDNVIAVNWGQKRSNLANKNFAEKRPPIESMIGNAHISSVSTLEGKWITRALYHLHFEGSKMISFEIPESYLLEKIYLNGTSISFKPVNNKISLQVFPSRAGDLSGTIELVMTRLYGNYHLSGSLAFIAPKASWPIHEMYLDLHLPDVFNYSKNSGSLEPIQESPESVFTYSLPLPGKKYSFHQYLITATAPTLILNYAVDLTKNYFSVEN